MSKASKDGKPKRPMSGFMIFSQEVRPKVKEENPELSFGEIAKKIGAMWKELDDSEKAPYNQKSAASKPASGSEKPKAKAKKHQSDEDEDNDDE